MAIVIDQANVGEFSQDTSGSTIAITTVANVAAGGFIVLNVSWAIASSLPTLSSVSGGGLTWTIDRQGATGATGAADAVVSAQAPSGLASGTAITATLSGSSPGARVLVASSWTGVATSTPVDVAGTIQAITSTTAWTTGNLTVAAGSLIVGFAAGLNTDGTSTATSPSIETHDVTGGAGSYNDTSAYRIESGAGTVAVAGTFSTAQTGAGVGVAYKAGGGSTKQIVPATINATSSMSGSVAKLAKITGTANATSNVTANVAKVALAKPGTINATSIVSARVNKLAAIVGSINATSPVNATLSKLGQKSIVPASISATSTVSAALQRLAALSVSMTATSFVTVLGQIVQALLAIELDRVSREAGLGLGSMYEYSAYTMATSAEHAEHARVNAGVGLGAGSHIDFTNAAQKTDEASTEGNRVKDLAGIGGGSHANL